MSRTTGSDCMEPVGVPHRTDARCKNGRRTVFVVCNLILAIIAGCTREEVADVVGTGAHGLGGRRMSTGGVSASFSSASSNALFQPGGSQANDGNTPLVWNDSTLYSFTALGGLNRYSADDQFGLDEHSGTYVSSWPNSERHLEGVIPDTSTGTWYGYYHNEVIHCQSDSGVDMCEKLIGACRSTDCGLNWTDLGVIIEADPDSFSCSDENEAAMAGGCGDFSVVREPGSGAYVYFFFTNYSGPEEDLGICVARMAWEDRDDPQGNVYRYYSGGWAQPGISGRATPVLPAITPWPDPAYEGVWGPSVHYNRSLGGYVMLMNYTRPPHSGDLSGIYNQAGIYMSYSPRLTILGVPVPPVSWSEPDSIFMPSQSGHGWYWHDKYPEVVGLDDSGGDTEQTAGATARFYIGGKSQSGYELIEFSSEGE